MSRTENSALQLGDDLFAEIVAHCLARFPEEACGLLAGEAGGRAVTRVYPVENTAHSALRYVVDPRAHLRADRDAEDGGLAIIGVFHSHTHTDPYPSPTDVAEAPDPSWHYMIVSLRDEVASLRSYRIVGAAISEEPVELVQR